MSQASIQWPYRDERVDSSVLIYHSMTKNTKVHKRGSRFRNSQRLPPVSQRKQPSQGLNPDVDRSKLPYHSPAYPIAFLHQPQIPFCSIIFPNSLTESTSLSPGRSAVSREAEASFSLSFTKGPGRATSWKSLYRKRRTTSTQLPTSSCVEPSTYMMPGQPPERSRTQQLCVSAARLSAPTFLRDVIWWVRIRALNRISVSRSC